MVWESTKNSFVIVSWKYWEVKIMKVEKLGLIENNFKLKYFISFFITKDLIIKYCGKLNILTLIF